MKKTLFKFALITLSTVALNCSVFAQTSDVSPQIHVISTVDGISEETIKNSITENLVDEDGNKTPMDVNVSIKELPSSRTNGNSEKKYSMEVYASTSKVETNTYDVNKNSITATGYLRMDWTDVTGPKNTMDELSGYWNASKGNITSCRLQYGPSHNQVSNTLSVSDDFSYSVKNFTSPSLHACYTAYLEGKDKNGNTVKTNATVCVHPSILD